MPLGTSTRLLLAAWLLTAAPAASAAAPDAVELLRASSLAPAVAYSGEVSVVTWFGRQGRSGPADKGEARSRELLVRFSPPNRFRREIVDRYGFASQVIVSDGRDEWFYDRGRRRAWQATPEDADYKVLGPDEELELLVQNYDAGVAGEETVAGRACWVVELRAKGGGSAARTLWIDKRHRLILQAKSFQPDGSLASTMRYLKIEFSPSLDPELFRFTPPIGADVVKSRLKPGYLELEDAQLASGVAPRQPGWLPAGYVFESVNVVPYRGSTLLHFRYSDGIDAISLFQCPPGARLDFGDLPRERVRVGAGRGRLSFGPDGKILEWPGRGSRFVLVGNVSLDALRRVAESVQ